MNRIQQLFRTKCAMVAWLLICSGVLSACGGGDSTAVAAVAAPDFQVSVLKPGAWVVMGSSTAAGAGASSGKSWVELIQAETRNNAVPLVNLAKGGTLTYHGLSTTATPKPGRPLPDLAANIDQALLRNPAFLIVAYPTSDTASGYTVEETVSNLLSIRRLALDRAVPVMILSTQPRNLPSAQLALLPLIDQGLSAMIGPCFVDVRTGLAGPDGHLATRYDSGDGVHPNDEGHQLIATRVQAALDGGGCIQVAKL